MMVDLFMSRVRPFGTGMSSNSLRCGRGGDDAQAVRVSTIAVSTRKRRMSGTSWPPSYSRRGTGAKFLTWLMLVSLLAGCASTNVPPMGYRGQPFRPEADERAMWSQAEKEEEKLAKTGKLYEDPLLDEYLSRLAA